MHQSQRSCLKEETVKTKLKFPTIQICFNKINRLNYTLSKTGRKKKNLCLLIFVCFCKLSFQENLHNLISYASSIIHKSSFQNYRVAMFFKNR